MGKLLGGATDAVGLTDSSATKKAAKESMQFSEEALNEARRLNLPKIEDMRLQLERAQVVGELTPEQMQSSAYENIQVDPRIKQAQMDALMSMRDSFDRGGLGAEEKLLFDQFRNQSAADESARQQSILQSMAERGNLDGGAQLAAQLASKQSTANQAADQGNKLALAAIQAKRSAAQDLANTGLNIGNQQFSQQGQVASAKDRINEFNTQSRSAAQQQNLANRQRVADSNVNIGNTQETANKALHQQNFQNQLQKTGAVTGQLGNMAGVKANEAAANAAADAATTGALVEAGTAFATGGLSLAAPKKK